MTFLTLTHALTVLQHSSWGVAMTLSPIGEFVLLCVGVPCYASACLDFLAHPSVQVNVWNRAM